MAWPAISIQAFLTKAFIDSPPVRSTLAYYLSAIVEQDRYSLLWITLPGPELKTVVWLAAGGKTVMTTQLSPLRTLIVDDSQDECVLLCAQLRGSDTLNVIGFVHDGMEALAYMRGANQFKKREIFPYPDLLLLDFQMPRCDGIGLLRKLKRQLFRPRVILWSSTLEQVDVPLALELGADLVCQKPFGNSELLEVVERIKTNLFGRTFDRFAREMPEPAHAGV